MLEKIADEDEVEMLVGQIGKPQIFDRQYLDARLREVFRFGVGVHADALFGFHGVEEMAEAAAYV
jgi:hypothetical protein